MNILFALGDRASAEDIRAELSDAPSYSAVRAMLAKLEAKGHVRHREEGLRYVYYPQHPGKPPDVPPCSSSCACSSAAPPARRPPRSQGRELDRRRARVPER